MMHIYETYFSSALPAMDICMIADGWPEGLQQGIRVWHLNLIGVLKSWVFSHHKLHNIKK